MIQFGYQITEAEDGVYALEIIKSITDFDAIIMDQMMPRMEGLDTFKKIKEMGAEIPVIMMTAHGSVNLSTEFMKLGGADFIQKPFDPEILHIKVQRSIREVRNKQEVAKAEAEKIIAMKIYQEKMDFLNNLGHEIRTPITIISSLCEQLDQNMNENNPDVHNKISKIKNNADSLIELIQEMSELAQIESQVIVFKKEDIDLENLLDSVKNIYSDEAKKKKISINVENRISQIKQIWTDKDKIVSVFCHLLDNAVKFSYHDSIINIQAEILGNQTTLSVTNHGSIIPVQDCERIFHPFTISKSSDIGSGGGIGLILSRVIVESLGGKIWVEKVNEDMKFCFTIPDNPLSWIWGKRWLYIH